ncbi:MAG TPA: hypothetical protein VFE10_16955 [Phenylobacterium sp.]|jgi:hypothetical protein|nr:hypothetical protein [Phenylobacterium sp.]
MSAVILADTLLVFIFLTCLLAFVKGGAPERIGAAVILANLVIGAANEALGQDQRIVLCIDGMTALVLLTVAVRYASFWLGGVMLLYGVQFALHAFYFVLERPRDSLHVAVNNGNFLAIGLCLAAGTAMNWMRSRNKTASQSGAAP